MGSIILILASVPAIAQSAQTPECQQAVARERAFPHEQLLTPQGYASQSVLDTLDELLGCMRLAYTQQDFGSFIEYSGAHGDLYANLTFELTTENQKLRAKIVAHQEYELQQRNRCH